MQAQTHNDGAAEAITNAFSVGSRTRKPRAGVFLTRKTLMHAIQEGMQQ